MDGEKFDSLIKRFCSTGLTRKEALRGLAAGAAAAVSGVAFARGDAAGKRKKGKSHKKKGVRSQATTVFGCRTDHVALCHNSTANNGGSIICPDASSADLQG